MYTSLSLTRDCLYTTCTLYYLSASCCSLPCPSRSILTPFDADLRPPASSIGTSFLPYTHNRPFVDFLTDKKYHLPKFAMSTFPNEIAVLPQAFVARTGNLVWYRGRSPV